MPNKGEARSRHFSIESNAQELIEICRPLAELNTLAISENYQYINLNSAVESTTRAYCTDSSGFFQA